MSPAVHQRVDAFNQRVPWPFRLVLVFCAGMVLYRVGAQSLYTAWAAALKIEDRGRACPWPRIATLYSDLKDFDARNNANLEAVSVLRQDPSLDIEQLASPKGPFWIRRSGENRDGHALLAYLLAEQDWMAEHSPDHVVRRGDIVFDCGAHVGVFTHKALELGASKVVAIEPDAINLECLRRNFQPQIAAGQVVVVDKGVWDREGVLTFFKGVANSAMGSFVHEQGGQKVELPVTTIDALVARLGLERVDYIKMDIEGSEREALRGALATLRRFRPRLMLDSYHERDDAQVLPAVIRQAHAGYTEFCGPCQPENGALIAHVIYFQ